VSSLRTLVKPGVHASVDGSAVGSDIIVPAVTGKSIVICDVTVQGASEGSLHTESGGGGIVAYVVDGHQSYTAPIRVPRGKPLYSNINAPHTITYYLM
tara:strand:+ start:302 stop:595 length:294 start_codon:yes stop_codon:yes gene_type:complete